MRRAFLIGLISGSLLCQPGYAVTATNVGNSFSTSADLRGLLSDETGSGVAVFGTSPTFTTSVLIPDGTASVPSLTFTSDADGTGTGIYRNTTNQVAFSANGTKMVGITGSGLNVSDGYYIFWLTRSAFGSPSDGVITIANNAQNDFGRLQFGGTTSSFPSLKRSTTTLQVKLADDSAPAALTAYKVITNDADGATLTATDCMGNIWTNTGAAGAQTLNLPAAAAGMHVTILLSAAFDVDINPDNSDQILVLTNAVGDAISSDAVQGRRIELVAIDATNWMVLDSAGTWTDVN